MIVAKALDRSSASPALSLNDAPKVSMRDQLLQAAEFVFAEFGYKGATVRQITTKANVTVGLMRYYFGSKSELFQQVIGARSEILCERLTASLAALDLNGMPFDQKLAAIVRAYAEPHWELMEHDPSWKSYYRMIYQLPTLEERDLLARLLIQLHADVADAYRAAFRGVLGDQVQVDPAWHLLLLIVSRALIEWREQEPPGNISIDHIVLFCAGGIAALAGAPNAPDTQFHHIRNRV